MKEGLDTAAIIQGYGDVLLPRYSWRVYDDRKSEVTWKAGIMQATGMNFHQTGLPSSLW